MNVSRVFAKGLTFLGLVLFVLAACAFPTQVALADDPMPGNSDQCSQLCTQLSNYGNPNDSQDPENGGNYSDCMTACMSAVAAGRSWCYLTYPRDNCPGWCFVGSCIDNTYGACVCRIVW